MWWLYADLKGYCRDPTAPAKAALKRRGDTHLLHPNRLCHARPVARPRSTPTRRSCSAPSNGRISRFTTFGSENDIRCQVTRRKISGGTRSQTGRDCRDAFLGLMKTCDKLDVSFWDYLGSRLDIPDAPTILPLPDLIRQRAQPP